MFPCTCPKSLCWVTFVPFDTILDFEGKWLRILSGPLNPDWFQLLHRIACRFNLAPYHIAYYSMKCSESSGFKRIPYSFVWSFWKIWPKKMMLICQLLPWLSLSWLRYIVAAEWKQLLRNHSYYLSSFESSLHTRCVKFHNALGHNAICIFNLVWVFE